VRFLDSDLLQGERLLLSKFANAIIRPADYHLSRFAADDLLWLVGMKDKEAIGGKLHLTTYRLLFRSHAANRLTGEFELFLPAVLAVRDASYLWTRKFAIDTAATHQEFIIWGIRRFVEATDAARAALTAESLATIRESVLARGTTLALKTQDGVEFANQVFAGVRKIAEASELVDNPLKAIAFMAARELFDDTLAERWDARFH
jgi:hypothetical protein